MIFSQNNPDSFQGPDWAILMYGWTCFYLKNEFLEKDISWFKKENYSIASFDCKTWLNKDEMYNQLKDKLGFPDYFGKNYDALNDCLRDIEISEDSGQIIIFRHLDFIDKDQARILLEIFSIQARTQILFGNKLIILVQVDDPNYQLNSTGETFVHWNQAEWLNSSRNGDIIQ